MIRPDRQLSAQVNTTLPELPERIASKPFSNSV
jgi:hypothetical protein